MIATFIYTECQSSGVFKSEPGFKVKDVSLWKVKDNRIFQDQVNPSNAALLEQLIMETVGRLPHYESPKMSPFIMQSEFLKLEKQWAYLTISGGYKAFVRMSSTGLSNGRRGNPFHMGIIFDTFGIGAMQTFWRKANGSKQVFTPADLFSWSGWLDPRTDQELEESKLDSGSFPTPTLLPKKREIDDSEFITNHRAEIRTALVEVEKSLRTQTPAQLTVDDTWDFMKVASVVTKLIPPSLVWSMNLQSSHLDKPKSELGWRKALVKEGSEHRSVAASTWASISLNLIEVDGFREIEPLLSAAGGGIFWNSTSTASGLWFLPLVLLLYSAQTNDFLTQQDVNEAYDVAMATWPSEEVRFKSN